MVVFKTDLQRHVAERKKQKEKKSKQDAKDLAKALKDSTGKPAV